MNNEDLPFGITEEEFENQIEGDYDDTNKDE